MIARHAAVRVIGWSAAGLLTLGTLAGLAEARSGDRAATLAQSQDDSGRRRERMQQREERRTEGKRKRARARRVGGRIQHGEWTVRTGEGFTVVVGQQGEVTEVSPTTVTLRSADGFTATYSVTRDTKVRRDGKSASIAAVRVGDHAWALAEKTGSKLRRLVARSPESSDDGREPAMMGGGMTADD